MWDAYRLPLGLSCKGIEVEDLRLAIVILSVQDLVKAVRFYGEAFGWGQTVNKDVYAEFDLPNGQRLGLYERSAFARNTGVSPSIPTEGGVVGTELYFTVTDIQGAVRRLAGAGARQLSEPKVRDWGHMVAYFGDPDGNVIALAQPG
jgi:uncharacterized protein